MSRKPCWFEKIPFIKVKALYAIANLLAYITPGQMITESLSNVTLQVTLKIK